MRRKKTDILTVRVDNASEQRDWVVGSLVAGLPTRLKVGHKGAGQHITVCPLSQATFWKIHAPPMQDCVD